MTLERRILSSDLTVRATGGLHQMTGHAAVFNRDSELIAGSFIERVAPGAFTESINAGDDVRALINHNSDLILGRTVSKTLTLREDEQGLHVTILPPNTSYARDLLESTKRGDISQMSFGFQVPPGGDRWEHGKNGQPDVRTLLKVKLFDVSPVTYPAYPDTDVAVRSHAAFLGHGYTEIPCSPETDVRRRRLESEALVWCKPGDWPVHADVEIRRRRNKLENMCRR